MNTVGVPVTPLRLPSAKSSATRSRVSGISMLDIATYGLSQRAALDSSGSSEVGFLQPLQELVDRGQTRAEELLALYQNEWKGDLSRLFEEYNFL